MLESVPLTGVYQGPSPSDYPHLHRRTVTDYETVWRRELSSPSTLDQLLVKQLREAIKYERTDVVVIDIGGGEGYLLRDFLSREEVGVESRGILRDNPQLRLHLISLTDSETESDFLQSQELKPFDKNDGSDNTQISAASVSYSITSSQTLEMFLKGIGEPQVDFYVSLDCLMCLKPPVFAGVVRDIASSLRPGGEAILVNYASPGAIFSRDETEEQEEPVFLRVGEGTQLYLVPVEELRLWAEQLLAQDDATDEEIMELKTLIMHAVLREDALSVDDLLHHGQDFRSTKDVLQFAMSYALGSASDVIKYRKDRNAKQRLLDELQTDREGEIDIEKSKFAIRITKKNRA